MRCLRCSVPLCPYCHQGHQANQCVFDAAQDPEAAAAEQCGSYALLELPAHHYQPGYALVRSAAAVIEDIDEAALRQALKQPAPGLLEAAPSCPA